MSPSDAEQEPLIRDISDTARWVAMYRAAESERPDAHFQDPFARRLAGPRGEAIARAMKGANRNAWAFVARTVAYDDFIRAEIARGVDVVVNLAAGMDARPYRLELPPALTWIEVDLAPLLDAKQAALKDERPRCRLQRIPCDLADVAARRALFAELGARGRDVLVVSEGLIVYLAEPEVAALARDLAALRSFRHWLVDIASPPLLRMLQQSLGKQLDRAGTPLRFGPAEGPGFFVPHGWRAREIVSPLKLAAKLQRLSFLLRLMAKLPEADPPWKRPWSGICLLERAGA